MATLITDGAVLAATAEQIILSSDDLRNDIESLMRDSIRHMRRTLKFGTPTEKAAIHRMLLTATLKGMGNIRSRQADMDDELAHKSLRDALARAIAPHAFENVDD